ncbi:O-methyltransferase [Agrococcus sp. SGAir0287]|uniref:O-methyltransferase n=1 Tax=Agrococcus sp. SGAir0287 TaxID=2070347 RepID=UPI0010CD310E|nr:class I SAM-dependent methyltransferase [Agrococcus sp. SGAir0287]QCR18861.1 methyltransferase [Agrococcus sp. SGAir0287]
METALTSKYLDELAPEDAVIAAARDAADELGIVSVEPAVGALLALTTATLGAGAILEIGTGTGVSGLWLLRGAPAATLTSIDTELDHHAQARAAFTRAGYAQAKVRLITGSASEVLPRMNEASYDVVLVDADPADRIEHVEHALRLVRVGGTVLVAHALLGGRVADPAQRGDAVADARALLKELSASDAVAMAVSPAGDGLLHVTRLPEP